MGSEASKLNYAHIAVETLHGVCVVRLHTKRLLEPCAIESWRRELLEAADCRLPVVLDCNQLEYISSSGFAVFVQLSRAVRAGGRRLALCAVRPAIGSVLRITRLERILPAYPDIETAMASVTDWESRLVCPVFDCSGIIAIRGPESQDLDFRCPDCGSHVRVHGAHVNVDSSKSPNTCGRVCTEIEVPSYENECVGIRYDAKSFTFTVCVQGRLDLYASESFEMAWRTIPAPNHIVLDLSQVASVTGPGLDAILGLLAQEPNARSTVIHLGGQQDDLAAKLRGRVCLAVGDRPTEGIIHEVPIEAARPIVVRSA